MKEAAQNNFLPVIKYKHYSEGHFLGLLNPEDGGSTVLRNAGTFSPTVWWHVTYDLSVEQYR